MSNYILHSLKFENCTFVERKISGNENFDNYEIYVSSVLLTTWLYNLFLSRKKKHCYIKYNLMISNQEFIFNSNFIKTSVAKLKARVLNGDSIILEYDIQNPMVYKFYI